MIDVIIDATKQSVFNRIISLLIQLAIEQYVSLHFKLMNP